MPKKANSQVKPQKRRVDTVPRADMLTAAERDYIQMVCDPFGDSTNGTNVYANVRRPYSATPEGSVQLVLTADSQMSIGASGDLVVQAVPVQSSGTFGFSVYAATGTTAGTLASEAVLIPPGSTIASAIIPAGRKFHVDAVGLKVWSSTAATAATGIITGGISDTAIHPSAYTAVATLLNSLGSQQYFTTNDGITVRYSDPQLSTMQVPADLAANAATAAVLRPMAVITGLPSSTVFVRAICIIEVLSDQSIPLLSTANPVGINSDLMTGIISQLPYVAKGHSFLGFISRAAKITAQVIKFANTHVLPVASSIAATAI